MKSPGFRKVSGGVCVPRGFLSSGVAAGIKKSGGRDLALIVSEKPCHAAGTFTTNSVKAAPVLLDIQRIHRPIRGIVINSGNANACTGRKGFQDAETMAEIAGNAVSSEKFPNGGGNYLVCSTGRIGVKLPMKKIERGIRRAVARLARNDQTAAEAIMTTDTFPKKIAVELRISGAQVRIGGIAKGAGMIRPGMSPSGRRPALHATMLSFLTTDIVMRRSLLQACLNRAVAQSFNRITVDGDMSTNDIVLLLANGCAGNQPLQARSADLQRFQSALNHVTLTLAKMIVKDGEGISKVVTLEITGAASASDAERAIRAIGNSTLVKCSWCGEDTNWGRIYDAIGYSGARFNFSKLSLQYDHIPLIRNELQMDKNLKRVHRVLQQPAFSIQCDLGLGKYGAILYTTDLTERYVQLNKGE